MVNSVAETVKSQQTMRTSLFAASCGAMGLGLAVLLVNKGDFTRPSGRLFRASLLPLSHAAVGAAWGWYFGATPDWADNTLLAALASASVLTIWLKTRQEPIQPSLFGPAGLAVVGTFNVMLPIVGFVVVQEITKCQEIDEGGWEVSHLQAQPLCMGAPRHPRRVMLVRRAYQEVNGGNTTRSWYCGKLLVWKPQRLSTVQVGETCGDFSGNVSFFPPNKIGGIAKNLASGHPTYCIFDTDGTQEHLQFSISPPNPCCLLSPSETTRGKELTDVACFERRVVALKTGKPSVLVFGHLSAGTAESQYISDQLRHMCANSTHLFVSGTRRIYHFQLNNPKISGEFGSGPSFALAATDSHLAALQKGALQFYTVDGTSVASKAISFSIPQKVWMQLDCYPTELVASIFGDDKVWMVTHPL